MINLGNFIGRIPFSGLRPISVTCPTWNLNRTGGPGLIAKHALLDTGVVQVHGILPALAGRESWASVLTIYTSAPKPSAEPPNRSSRGQLFFEKSQDRPYRGNALSPNPCHITP
jgi:hypothetical protein